ncbi:uncharacterized protein LOC124874298 [Girardinichthys multiradiatus]|uniref:uncharacterized protein LOC124874298 n=1 Tax=Girardinichthys multiradiatus TaxID=208333 RepID=UPI001FACA310|nr:uncharacterized protein LOC124874298 [Girardinichthys multiradiatus]
MNPDSEDTARLVEEHDALVDEEDEGFSELSADPTVLDMEVSSGSSSTVAPSSSSTVAPSSSSTVAPSSSSTVAPSSSSTVAPSSSSTVVPSSSSTVAPSSSSTVAPSSSSTVAPSSSSTVAPSSSSTVVPSSSSTVAPSSSSTVAPSSSSTVAPSSSSTVAPSSSSTVAPSTSSMLSEAGDTSNETLAVDDQNVPGYQHVDRLAEYLVGLREQTSLCLTNLQADCITELWQRLDDRDKQRVVYAARHQDRLLSGRFRTPKKPSKTPGVESTTRCVLGASSAPAQWPDCCRLVETIFIRLCGLHSAPKRKGKGAESRWSLILRDYRKIRDLVVGNARVMQGTEIQLVEVNQNTLIQWHNGRQKKQELSVLLQGTAVPPNLPVSEEPLMDARVLPSVPVPAQYEHQYQLPECTAGQAKQRQAPSAIQPKGATKRPSPLLVAPAVFPAPAAWAPSAPGIPHQALAQAGQPVVLYQMVPPAEIQGTHHQQPPTKRPYKRTVQANTCKKFGLFRTAETGHSHYRGRVYCPQSEVLTKEQWLEEMRK